jgi:wyosine [tRNA(Phe)-imidazoG37] synthetase (radical SAM superfamily)
VLSRRSGGVSFGVNLNLDKGCNFDCPYCQVNRRVPGRPQTLDVARIRAEAEALLDSVDDRGVCRLPLFDALPDDHKMLRDIALSGDGEPTGAREFDRVVELIGRVRAAVGVPAGVQTVLITNGSLVQRAEVQAGLCTLATLAGEVWFKLDRATPGGIQTVNDVTLSPAAVRRNLVAAARLCPTRVQTCVFALDGAPPSDAEVEAYVELLRATLADGAPIRGVFLYGLARPPMQPEASRLANVPAVWMEALAARVRGLGLPVTVTP